jgi:phosphoenolpyruvate carboxykinase (ATP)
MEEHGRIQRHEQLEAHGLRNANDVWWNLSTPALYEHAVQRHEGLIGHLGPLVVRTGQYTGRSPKDRYIVREPSSKHSIHWGKINQPFDAAHFKSLHARLRAYFQGKDLYIQDCYVGAEPAYQIPIRVVTETAWHSMFARNMFVQEDNEQRLATFKPEFTIIQAPGFSASPDEDGTSSEAFILLHFGRQEVIIGGTAYAGEIKKSMFTVMNYFLPPKGVLPMHCSANAGVDGDNVSLFFGLSGTGKTTLSADPHRTLIGDDEHGWSDDGVFNFEGGCYAKVIRLSAEGEPEIYATTRRFGTILENVALEPASRRPDLDSDAFTENTRASYPISHIPNASRTGRGGHPRHIVMLTADAFGVLPPIARLSSNQAMYHFLSGYTAKVAGTERGVSEPQATFSACFGAPFMPLNPVVYAKLLGDKIAQHESRAWLVNTGWSGGPYGTGTRIKLSYTRAMIRAILEGRLDDVATREDPIFGLQVPRECPEVPSEVLDPRSTWSDAAAYDEQAGKLATMFGENFGQYAGDVESAVLASGPR